MNEEEERPSGHIVLTEDEEKAIIKNAEFVCTFGKTPDAELTKKELISRNGKSAWIQVQVPFSGTYESMWSSFLQSVEETIHDRMEYDDGLEGVVSQIKLSPGWEGFLCNLTGSEELEEYLSGKARVTFDVPLDMEDILDANLSAVRDILDYTLAAHTWGKAVWKWDEMWSPKEYNFTTDKIYYLLDRTTWKRVAWKSVFHSKWYKRYARWQTTARSGYVPFSWHKYENYFDLNDGCCTAAVLLFWLTVGAYAYENMIAPIKRGEFNRITDELYFNEDTGINEAGALRLIDELAYDKWCQGYDLSKTTLW